VGKELLLGEELGITLGDALGGALSGNRAGALGQHWESAWNAPGKPLTALGEALGQHWRRTRHNTGDDHSVLHWAKHSEQH
jgi:hypothetical protein